MIETAGRGSARIYAFPAGSEADQASYTYNFTAFCTKKEAFGAIY